MLCLQLSYLWSNDLLVVCMTKINRLRVNLAMAVLLKRKVTMDGMKITGVMIGFIEEKQKPPSDGREANRQTIIWAIHDRAITVSKQVISKMKNGRMVFK